MKFHSYIFLLCMCAGADCALAQSEPPVIGTASLVYKTEGVVQGCGLRLTMGEPKRSAPSVWFDVSVNVFRRGIALVQAIGYEISPSELGESRPARVPLQSAWLNAMGGKAKLGENEERLDSLVYTVLPDDALSLFEAVARGEPISLGVKRWGQRVESVYSGAPVLTEETRGQVGDCLTSLSE